jgi:hypothetical protein
MGAGRVAREQELPDAFQWRRFRLAIELTDRYYRRAGLAPTPVHGPISDDLYTLPITSSDCDLGPRAFGRIGGALHRDDMGVDPGVRWANLTPLGPSSGYPDGQSWPEWVDEVSRLLGFDRLDDEGGRRPTLRPRGWRAAVRVAGCRVPSCQPFFASRCDLIPRA